MIFLRGLAIGEDWSQEMGIELNSDKKKRIKLEQNEKAEGLTVSVHLSFCASVSVAEGHTEPHFQSQVLSSSMVYKCLSTCLLQK